MSTEAPTMKEALEELTAGVDAYQWADDDYVVYMSLGRLRRASAALKGGEQVPVGWKLTDEMVEKAAMAIAHIAPRYTTAAHRIIARAALEAVCAMFAFVPAPSPSPVQSREEKLKKALELALALLFPREPPDSRAVSDEFVALASVLCGDDNTECWEIIERALASHNLLPQEGK